MRGRGDSSPAHFRGVRMGMSPPACWRRGDAGRMGPVPSGQTSGAAVPNGSPRAARPEMTNVEPGGGEGRETGDAVPCRTEDRRRWRRAGYLT